MQPSVSHCVMLCVSQVGLTRRPLCNDQKCGKREDANLATRHTTPSVSRSGCVISHSGVKNDDQPSDSQRWLSAARCRSAPARSSCCSSASPSHRHRPTVPLKRYSTEDAETPTGTLIIYVACVVDYICILWCIPISILLISRTNPPKRSLVHPVWTKAHSNKSLS